MNQHMQAVVPGRLLLLAAGLAAAFALPARAADPVSAPVASAATSVRPQVVIAIGNSESMDGLLAGAIMTGAGQLRPGLSSLYSSSSPPSYTVPTGFAPPLAPAVAGSAPYTVRQGAGLADNSPSRLNIAKSGIKAVVRRYLPTLDFALVDFDAADPGSMSTWVYYMPPAGDRFVFAKAQLPGARYVTNPCHGYKTASTDVASDCAAIADEYGSDGAALNDSPWMQIGASSDDIDINDVLLDNRGIPGVVEDLNGPDPATPYPPDLTLAQYNDDQIRIAYHASIPSGAAMRLAPSNAGYVPYTARTLFVQRGYGYYAHAKGDDGTTVVPMTSGLGAKPTDAALATATAPFDAALAPETDDPAGSHTGELKSLAYQSPLAGLVSWAGKVARSAPQSCPGQYIILVTDGLPTEDLAGKFWPPLGSAAGAGYGLYAGFYGIPADAAHGLRDAGPIPAGAVSGQFDAALSNDQALIDTIGQLQDLSKAGVSTYVIGLGAGVDPKFNPAAHAALDAMAIAGGTTHVYPANDAPAFNAAVEKIAAQIPPCIAAPPSVVLGSVYFDFDHYNIRGAYHGNAKVIARQLRYLKAHPDAEVQLQGNCDARGSDEYNLALGQKRAEAAMKALQAAGIAPSRMEAISYGVERPRAQGSSEAAYAENRRTDFAYPQK